jgi:hypothetical protein
MLKQVGNLEAYLGRYGLLLGKAAREKLRPLHIPARDTANVATLLRSPFDPQAHVIAAGVKLFNTGGALLLVGECGTGKTIMGQAIPHTHAAGRPYRGIVFCPPHLTKKWQRELEETLPGVKAIIVGSYRELTHLRHRSKPKGPEWYIMSNSVAKLGTAWVAAFLRKRKTPGIAHCPDCWEPVMEKDKETDRMLPVPIATLEKKKHACNHCGAQLWQFTPKYDRWPAATYVHHKLRGVFRYLLVDEVHEEKGDDTAQANAMGALAAGIPFIGALTGTLIGGYADHLRTLLFRLAPRSLVQEGFGWSSHMPFNEKYGRIEVKITEKQKNDPYSLRTCRGSSRTKTKYVRPGVMPTLFGKHLIDKTIFLALEEVAENLPDLDEQIIGVPLDDEQRPAYEIVEAELSAVVKEMVVKGDKRLLGAMLQTLLCYPDKPYGWPMIGYYETDKYGAANWVDVVQPADLDPVRIRPKEEAIVRDVLREHRQGRKTWIYTVMTDKRDVCCRLQSLLEAKGLRVAVLRASVETKKREEWIAKNGPTHDVIISHPQLVQTGLDLFDKAGRYNFPTLAFYLTGYNTFTLRQASRRAWRIGQHEPCRVLYYYYKGTMQERAMELMGKKLSAAEAIEGKFSAEGLAAMAGEEGSAEMALARSLVNRIGNQLDATRAWKRISARPTAPRVAQPMVMAPVEAETPEIILPTRRFESRPMPGALAAKQLSLFGDVA